MSVYAPVGVPAEILVDAHYSPSILYLQRVQGDGVDDRENAGVADAKIRTRITELGGTPLGGSAAAFGTIIAEATEKWAKVIKFAGIRTE